MQCEICTSRLQESIVRALLVHEFQVPRGQLGTRVTAEDPTCSVLLLQELIAALAEECDASQIPSAYGGSAPTPLYESKVELELREFVSDIS